MKKLRWVFVILYAIIVLGLFSLVFTGKNPFWLFPWYLDGDLYSIFTLITATLISQFFFLAVPASSGLCRPVRKPRLIAPVAMASLLMAVLLGAVLISFIELFYIEQSQVLYYMFWGYVGLNWLIWFIFFYLKSKDKISSEAIKYLTVSLISDSLLELLAAIPSHLIVSRRPGCFVGMFTSFGLACGILVMLWAFGPGIILLFYKHYRDSHHEH